MAEAEGLRDRADGVAGDQLRTARAEAASEMARRCARDEGMLMGVSNGAAAAASVQKLPELPSGSRVRGFDYDTGERYLSIVGFLPA